MSEKNDNKSLYIYAGLIFLVAIMIIIIAFFGQENIIRENSNSLTAQTAGITERASALSDENRVLLEKVNSLNNQLEEKTAVISDLETQLSSQTLLSENLSNLIKCYKLCAEQKFDEAKQLFESLDMEYISDDAMPLYKDVSKKIIKRK